MPRSRDTVPLHQDMIEGACAPQHGLGRESREAQARGRPFADREGRRRGLADRPAAGHAPGEHVELVPRGEALDQPHVGAALDHEQQFHDASIAVFSRPAQRTGTGYLLRR
jgi:hypothetical protein